ncbi:MAG: cobyrinate a,c-diamide synthase [SAR324 cluster bacterium]|nr:cobyrinate a,c-diamide synthase [SAR324 cluster bacterium]
MISAPYKSSGKTTISIGLLSNLVAQGETVRSFKKGPDYIDSMWLKLASKKDCYNLDPYLMAPEVCRTSLLENSTGAGMALIEGNLGLHDGLDIEGSNSSAGLAKVLDAPVLLVVDSRKMNRGVAALVLGQQAMQPETKIAGVILNQVRSNRQEEKQRRAIETFCKIPVLGAIPEDKEVVITERHLGLTTVRETEDAQKIIRRAHELVENYCDVKEIKSLFELAAPIEKSTLPNSNIHSEEKSVKIGVFYDSAFCFYYPDNFNALRRHGAELVFIDSFKENSLPEIDGLYLGGGFPESFFESLSDNKQLLKDLNDRVQAGLPLYAECGGLIYLCQAAHYNGRKYPLAGILPFEVGYQKRPVGYGYLDLQSNRHSSWFAKDVEVKAHEFHYSKLIPSDSRDNFQFKVKRGYGCNGSKDGVLYQNLFASFAHLHSLGSPNWAHNFVKLAGEFKSNG